MKNLDHAIEVHKQLVEANVGRSKDSVDRLRAKRIRELQHQLIAYMSEKDHCPLVPFTFDGYNSWLFNAGGISVQSKSDTSWSIVSNPEAYIELAEWLLAEKEVNE